MESYITKFECNENTTLKEILDFLESYRDYFILIHYENNIEDEEDIIELRYSSENLPKINDILTHCYVNGIYIQYMQDPKDCLC